MKKTTMKVLLVGNSGVGKSSLLLKFADNAFTNSFITTIGVDMRMKEIEISPEGTTTTNENEKITAILQVWDTAGQERFRTITTAYYRGAHGIILVYDTTSPESLEDLVSWTQEIIKEANDNIPVIVVGTKIDTESAIENDALKNTLHSIETYVPHIDHMTCSSKTGQNVDNIFITMAKKIYKSRNGKALSESIILDNEPIKSGGKCC